MYVAGLRVTLYRTLLLSLKPPAPKPTCEEGEAPPTKKPTRLALGVEGGFDGGMEPEVEWEELYEVVVLPSRAAVSLPNSELPQKVKPNSLAPSDKMRTPL